MLLLHNVLAFQYPVRVLKCVPLHQIQNRIFVYKTDHSAIFYRTAEDQMFAAGFFQIPTHDGHPCPWLCNSRY